ncbi:MAG: hypothetical protein KDK45_18870, partial [Leptospiraceae bacterium]|nr:hypothetical protein [Leptospiraceae bacterium]
ILSLFLFCYSTKQGKGTGSETGKKVNAEPTQKLSSDLEKLLASTNGSWYHNNSHADTIRIKDGQLIVSNSSGDMGKMTVEGKDVYLPVSGKYQVNLTGKTEKTLTYQIGKLLEGGPEEEAKLFENKVLRIEFISDVKMTVDIDKAKGMSFNFVTNEQRAKEEGHN